MFFSASPTRDLASATPESLDDASAFDFVGGAAADSGHLVRPQKADVGMWEGVAR